MPKLSIDLDASQVERALTQLTVAEQLRITKRVAAQQMSDIVGKLRGLAREKGLTSTKIRTIVERARQEVFDRRRR